MSKQRAEKHYHFPQLLPPGTKFWGVSSYYHSGEEVFNDKKEVPTTQIDFLHWLETRPKVQSVRFYLLHRDDSIEVWQEDIPRTMFEG